jgi:hypothetical protein
MAVKKAGARQRRDCCYACTKVLKFMTEGLSFLDYRKGRRGNPLVSNQCVLSMRGWKTPPIVVDDGIYYG